MTPRVKPVVLMPRYDRVARPRDQRISATKVFRHTVFCGEFRIVDQRLLDFRIWWRRRFDRLDRLRIKPDSGRDALAYRRQRNAARCLAGGLARPETSVWQRDGVSAAKLRKPHIGQPELFG